MKHAPLIPKPLFTRTKRLEIGSRLRHNISIQTKLDTAEGVAIRGDVEVDGVGDLGGGGLGGEEVGEEVHVELLV
jgi:hypothetical protein